MTNFEKFGTFEISQMEKILNEFRQIIEAGNSGQFKYPLSYLCSTQALWDLIGLLHKRGFHDKQIWQIC